AGLSRRRQTLLRTDRAGGRKENQGACGKMAGGGFADGGGQKLKDKIGRWVTGCKCKKTILNLKNHFWHKYPPALSNWTLGTAEPLRRMPVSFWKNRRSGKRHSPFCSTRHYRRNWTSGRRPRLRWRPGKSLDCFASIPEQSNTKPAGFST